MLHVVAGRWEKGGGPLGLFSTWLIRELSEEKTTTTTITTPPTLNCWQRRRPVRDSEVWPRWKSSRHVLVAWWWGMMRLNASPGCCWSTATPLARTLNTKSLGVQEPPPGGFAAVDCCLFFPQRLTVLPLPKLRASISWFHFGGGVWRLGKFQGCRSFLKARPSIWSLSKCFEVCTPHGEECACSLYFERSSKNLLARCWCWWAGGWQLGYALFETRSLDNSLGPWLKMVRYSDEASALVCFTYRCKVMRGLLCRFHFFFSFPNSSLIWRWTFHDVDVPAGRRRPCRVSFAFWASLGSQRQRCASAKWQRRIRCERENEEYQEAKEKIYSVKGTLTSKCSLAFISSRPSVPYLPLFTPVCSVHLFNGNFG